MMAAIGTLMVDVLATSYYHKSNLHVHVYTHGHAHGPVSSDQDSQLLRHRVISQVLDLGIVVHSVIVGISLGASESPKTILFINSLEAWDWVVVFHRFWMAGLVSCFPNYN